MRFEIQARVRRPSGFTLDVALACDTDALGVVGPSGSGKSTLLDAVAGIEPGARVVLDGDDCSRRPLHERGVGHVAQDAALFPHLNVRENLLYSPRATTLADVPEALGITPLLDRMPRHLSGGERRRAALARAILSRPRLLLLDEPFGGLDEPRRREAMSLLDRVRRRFALPMVLVSHRAEEVIGLTDWTIRLDDGRVTAAGPSPTVLRAGENLIDNYFTATVVGPQRARADSVELSVPLPEGVEGDVRLACYAHDILLATELPTAISARNGFRTRIASVVPIDGVTIVELERPRLRALVTAEAVRSLDVRAGADIAVVLKATSIVYLGRA